MAERLTNLHLLEESDASRSQISCTPGDIAKQTLGLEVVRGLTIVDLAAGASSLTALLLSEGADAHAVDFSYSDAPEVLAFRAINVLYEMSEQCGYQWRQAMVNVGEESIEQFACSMTENPGNYHKAFLTRLPFPDNFADLVTSLNGISALTDEPKLMEEMIEEALRVAKPGGRVIISPIHIEGDAFYDLLAAEHEEVISNFKNRGLVMEMVRGIEPKAKIPLAHFARLTIVKP